MNRTLFKLPFRSESLPRWRCPTCIEGVLALAKGTFTKEIGARTRKSWGGRDYYTECEEYVYSCVLKCTHLPCQEVVVTGGIGYSDWEEGSDQDGNPIQKFFSVFHHK